MARKETSRYPTGLESLVRHYFARRIVLAWELPAVMRRHIYTGAMANIWVQLISGLWLVYFGNRVGMTPFLWGLMGSITSFVLVAELFSALVTQRMGRRKLIWFVCAMTERLLRFGGIVLAAWLWHRGSHHSGLALLLVLSLAGVFGAMAVSPWLSWLADIIPQKEQGRFWGRRSAWIAMSVIAVVIPTGFFFDRTPEDLKLNASLLIFAIATIIGVLDLVIHGTIPEPKMDLPRRGEALHQLLVPLRDRNFRPWLAFRLAWSISVTIGAALATVYCVETLGLKNRMLGATSAITVTSLISGVLTAPTTGRWIDRLGPKKVLMWAQLGIVLNPVAWLLATPKMALFWLSLASISGGAAVTTSTNAQTKFITRFPPAEHRTMYIAASNCIGYIGTGIGALVAGVLYHMMGSWHWDAGWTTFGPHHVLFAMSIIGRLTTILVFIPRIHEPAHRT